MLFGCCHPALTVEARLALTLRAVVGMTTPQIARAFLVPESTMAQRLVRAKRKITQAGIPFAIPEHDELPPRLDDVLTVIYLAYNAGYLDPSPAGRELSEDAVWLAELVSRALPQQAEAWGLLSLLTFLSSRTSARFDDQNRLVLLEDQDRTRWDGVAISRADGYLSTAASLRRPGRFQLQAALAGCHASAAHLGRNGLAADPHALRHVAAVRLLAGDPAESGDRARPRPRSRASRWRRWIRWRIGWPTITCCTPPGRSCSLSLAIRPRHGPRTSGRSA